MKDLVIDGYAWQVEGRYACWNSFKRCWFLGPERLSEVFGFHLWRDGERCRLLSEARLLYPTGHLKEIPSEFQYRDHKLRRNPCR